MCAYRPARNKDEDAWETKSQIVSQASSPVFIVLVGHERTSLREIC